MPHLGEGSATEAENEAAAQGLEVKTQEDLPIQRRSEREDQEPIP